VFSRAGIEQRSGVGCNTGLGGLDAYAEILFAELPPFFSGAFGEEDVVSEAKYPSVNGYFSASVCALDRDGV